MAKPPFSIAPFEEKYRHDVVTLWEECFPNDPPHNEPNSIIERKMRVQPELFLLGIVERRAVATVLGGYDGYRGWIYHLATHPEQRRQGYGKRLVEQLQRLLKAQGCVKINLQVRATNSEVLAFYRKLGWVEETHTSFGKKLTA